MKRYTQTHIINKNITNPTNAYGPNARANNSTALIYTLLIIGVKINLIEKIKILKGDKILIFILIKYRMSGTLNLANVIAQNISVSSFTCDIIPSQSNVYSLGSVDKPFKDLFVSENTIQFVNSTSKVVSGTIGMTTGNDGETYFRPSTAMKIPSATGNDIIIKDGVINMGSTQIANNQITINGTVIGSNIKDEMLQIAKVQDNITYLENSSADDFGYLKDYSLKFGFGKYSNDILGITGANFEIGKLFNTENSLRLNNFIVKDLSKPLIKFDSAGTVEIYTLLQQNNRLNKKLNADEISTVVNEVSNYLVPIERNTTVKDLFPFNILDLNKEEGRNKFKSDFDSVGSLHYSTDISKLSGLCNLKRFAQLSHPSLISSLGNTNSITLNKYESVVDFITYYNLPILFDTQKEGDDITKYDYYLSSNILNRRNNIVYVYSANNIDFVSETLNNQVFIINSLKQYSFANLYPSIKVLKWKNIYSATFTKLKNSEYVSSIGWGTNINLDDIYTKYIGSGTNTGINWLRKLAELTFAFIKYAKPLKILTSVDILLIDSIMLNLSQAKLNSTLSSIIDLNIIDLSISINKNQFINLGN